MLSSVADRRQSAATGACTSGTGYGLMRYSENTQRDNG